MKIAGTINQGIVGNGRPFRVNDTIPNAVRITDSAISSGKSNLASELEKRDMLVREPLTSFTYLRDIPIKTGGGWVDVISALNSDHGVTGGSGDGQISSSNATTTPVIQGDWEKDLFFAHVFEIIMRIRFIDMQRSKVTGRSLEELLTNGIRMNYDKHLDQNTYIGMPLIGTYGIVNNPNVVITSVESGSKGRTEFINKTADEILLDINTLISDTWEQAENDLTALPNHIIMPYQQYNYIATTKVSEMADKTILTFILENNISLQNSGGLVIGATSYCKGAGVGKTDRMVCYVHNDRFIAMEELSPLSKTHTAINLNDKSYDSLYMANISQVEFFYNQTVRYADGI